MTDNSNTQNIDIVQFCFYLDTESNICLRASSEYLDNEEMEQVFTNRLRRIIAGKILAVLESREKEQ